MANRGLGKGLGALINAVDESGEGVVRRIPVDEIDPNELQPRKHFKRDSLEELAASIKEHGVLQPVVVRRKGSRYELIAGERRLQASIMAGQQIIPAIVMESDNTRAVILALVENIQREDLDPIEEAEALRQLIDSFGLTQEEVSAKIGKRRVTVANALRLLKLPDEVKSLVASRELSPGHARALLPLQDPELQIRLARRIVEKGLTVREVESHVRRIREGAVTSGSGPKRVVPSELRRDVEVFSQAIRRPATVRSVARGLKLEIVFENEDDLREFLASRSKHGA